MESARKDIGFDLKSNPFCYTWGGDCTHTSYFFGGHWGSHIHQVDTLTYSKKPKAEFAHRRAQGWGSWFATVSEPNVVELANSRHVRITK